MAAPRTTTPTQLPTVVLEPAPSTPPPAPTPKRYDTVDRPRVVLTTSPEVRKLQTLFRSACHDSPRLVPGARAGARSPASFSSLSPRSPRPGRESPTRRSPRRRPRSRGGPEGCSSPLFGRPSPRRSPLLSTPPPTQPLSSPRGLGGDDHPLVTIVVLEGQGSDSRLSVLSAWRRGGVPSRAASNAGRGG